MDDVEMVAGSSSSQLTNSDIRTFAWKNVVVTIKDRQTGDPKKILSVPGGIVKAGKAPRQARSIWTRDADESQGNCLHSWGRAVQERPRS